MSLRAFHFVFISLAILLSAGCGVGAWFSYQNYPDPPTLGFSIVSSVISIGLIFYGGWWFKKSRKIII